MDIKNYSFEHTYHKYGTNFYRLKILNEDGTYEYSKTVKVDNLSDNQALLILNAFPNPTTEWLNVQLEPTLYQNTTLYLFDHLGTQLAVYDNFRSSALKISLERYPEGLYILKGVSGDKIQTTKIIKSK